MSALREMFPQHDIPCGGDVPWPALSPDLSACDYFLWGYLKRRIFILPFRLPSKYLNINIYRNIILPVVLYGCKIWSLILREEHRLRVIENGVLKRIIGPKGYEVSEEWRKLYNEKLNP
jgi:hypothetical protein